MLKVNRARGQHLQCFFRKSCRRHNTKTRILVVDDNVTNLKLICDLLEMEGYVIDRALNAVQALSEIARHTPNLILMDIELPGTNGLVLTRILKTDPMTKDIPIVALTAFAMKGDDEKAFRAGCSGYITKPIDTRQIKNQVEEFLRADRLKKGEQVQ